MASDLPSSKSFQVAVIGGGPAGLACAISMAQAGISVALFARRGAYPDNRTTALLGNSIGYLDSLNVWTRCRHRAAALRVMRLVDDTSRLIRAPEVKFSSDEIGMEAFGYNIANLDLLAAMMSRADGLTNLSWIHDDARSVTPSEDAVHVETSNGDSISAQLVVGADGRHSLCREAAGIAVKRRELGQVALTLNVSHARPHNDCSVEFHTASGPCVFVPLPGNNSSVVWVVKSDDAARLQSLSDEQLAEAVERQSHSIFGRMTVAPGRNAFPLAIETPERLAANRIALIGEAAHVLPPIGAQGLNMGLRDAADIVAVAEAATADGRDPGSDDVLRRYERDRRADIFSRVFAVDMANRTLLADFLPAQSLRAAGLHALNTIGPVRRMAMREGLSPSWRAR
ncbi:MAG: UbiH/UbiF family hydroxylase [Rhizobiales bacterium]|nr:UbiH/UbiF family hydroxylase [Hyphomicrobiales bacterium]